MWTNGALGGGGPDRETRRSMSVRLYGLASIHEGGGGAELDAVVDLARALLGVEGAGVNLLVDDTQVTVATTADGGGVIPRRLSVCSGLLQTHPADDVVVVPDLRADPAYRDNPFVDGTTSAIRLYAIAPLTGKHGLALGTLCAWSEQPGALDDTQRRTLRMLSRAVVNILDERRRALVADAQGNLRPSSR